MASNKKLFKKSENSFIKTKRNQSTDEDSFGSESMKPSVIKTEYKLEVYDNETVVFSEENIRSGVQMNMKIKNKDLEEEQILDPLDICTAQIGR